MEPVVEVILPRVLHELANVTHFPHDDSANVDVGHVVDDYGKDQQRGGKGRQKLHLRPLRADSEGGEDEAQEITSRVPQKNRCPSFFAAKVIRKETETTADKNERKWYLERPFHLQENDGKKAGEDDAETRCQAIHPVDEVDGIGNPHQPEEGEGIIKAMTPPGHGEDGGAYPERDENAGCHELGKELCQGREFMYIVRDLHYEDETGGDEEAQDLT
jgi:hypothetical protein